MNRWAIASLVCASLLPAGAANAGPVTLSFGDVLRTMSVSTAVPSEWGGMWDVVDSTYECTGAPTGTSSYSDTLCAGQSVYDPPPGTPVAIDCVGTANATEVHVVCTGSAELIPDCLLTFVAHIDVVRTGEKYFSVSTVTTSYSGTGLGCDLIPGSCVQINSHGTRTGAAPAEYCAAVPVKVSSWGQVKAHYR